MGCVSPLGSGFFLWTLWVGSANAAQNQKYDEETSPTTHVVHECSATRAIGEALIQQNKPRSGLSCSPTHAVLRCTSFVRNLYVCIQESTRNDPKLMHLLCLLFIYSLVVFFSLHLWGASAARADLKSKCIQLLQR